MFGMTLPEAITKARECGACEEELYEIGRLGSWEKVFGHPGAPFWFYWAALHIFQGRWLDAEAIIATNPMWSYPYARDVIKGRWPEAEAFIAKYPQWAYWYAREVIKGRWPEAEAVIAKYPHWASLYHKENGITLPEAITKARECGAREEDLDEIGRLGSWEKVSLHPKAPFWFFWLTTRFFKSRWPGAEVVIATHPWWAYRYAKDVIKRRWPGAEAVIATHPRGAYWYAKEVIKGRWPAAEAIIAMDPELASLYAKENSLEV